MKKIQVTHSYSGKYNKAACRYFLWLSIAPKILNKQSWAGENWLSSSLGLGRGAIHINSLPQTAITYQMLRKTLNYKRKLVKEEDHLEDLSMEGIC